MAKRAPRGEQTKAESVTVRLSPKMKFGLEMLARRQRRTVSGVIEWALAQALDADEVMSGGATPKTCKLGGSEVTINELTLPLIEMVWAPHEAERIINLSRHAPNLLSFEEEVILRILQTFVTYISTEKADYTVGFLGGDEPQPRLINRLWDKIKACASGSITEEELEHALSLAYLRREGQGNGA